MAKIDTSAYKTFDDVIDRLDSILEVVRDKNTSLEKSLDLFDEAIAVGSKGVEMVDKVEFSDHEKALLDTQSAPDAASAAEQDSADNTPKDA